MKIHEKHALWLRLVHWLNVPLLLIMIWSGILIYWANDIYPGFFPERFYHAFHIPGRLAEGLGLHFFFAWAFILNGIIYLIYLFGSGHWRELFPDCETWKNLLPTILHDLGITHVQPAQTKFNAAQRVAYTGVILLAAVAVTSGFAIYKPVQLSWLTSLFGGYEYARLVHFIAMISFCLFIPMHLVQVMRAGWTDFRPMVGRTVYSFVILIVFAVSSLYAWHRLRQSPEADGQPRLVRDTLEFNADLWIKLMDLKKRNRGERPPPGKPARVNGDIGIEDEDSDWKLEVDPGQGKKPFVLTMDELKKLPRTETAAQLRCIEGWSEDMSFAGVKFSDFMRTYGIEKQNYVGLETANGDYYVSIDMLSMLHDQTLLAYEQNGLPLSRAHGAPLRLAIPIKYGIKNLKSIGRIFFSDQRPPDYWAERGYDWYAGL